MKIRDTCNKAKERFLDSKHSKRCRDSSQMGISVHSILLNCIETVGEKEDNIRLELDNKSCTAKVKEDQFFNNLLLDLMENIIFRNPNDIRYIRTQLREIQSGFEIAIASIWLNDTSEDVDEKLFPPHYIGPVAKLRANQIANSYCGYVTIQELELNDTTSGAELIICLPTEKNCLEVTM